MGFVCPLKTCSADIHDAVKVDVSKVFERMLMAVEKNKYEKITNAMQLLSPLTSEINQIYGVDINADLNKGIIEGNKTYVVRIIQQFIVYSIESHLSVCLDAVSNRQQMVPKIKKAYVEYLVLDPYVRAIDFEVSKKLKMFFRAVNNMVGVNSEEFQTSRDAIKVVLRAIFFEEY